MGQVRGPGQGNTPGLGPWTFLTFLNAVGSVWGSRTPVNRQHPLAGPNVLPQVMKRYQKVEKCKTYAAGCLGGSRPRVIKSGATAASKRICKP